LKAKEELINRNLRFVISVAKSYVRPGVTFPDLINEGNIGLIEAAGRFDPTTGNKFISYAIWWIRRYIMAYLSDTSTTIRLPINKRDAVARLNKRLSIAEQEQGRPVTYEDLIGEDTTKDEQEAIENLINIGQLRTISMDTPLDLGDGTGSMHEIIADDTFGGADGLVLNNDIKQMITNSLDKLKPVERIIITKRFGLDGHPKLTLSECGALPEVNISRERVRQIESRALGFLKRIVDVQALDAV